MSKFDVKSVTPATLPARYVPQPHIVDGIPYNVVDSPQAFMGREPGKAILASPHAPADVGRVLALHEEAHARFTPDRTPGACVADIASKYVDADDADRRALFFQRPDACSIVNVCEDTRVNAKLRHYLGVNADAWQPVVDHYARLGHSVAPRHIKESVTQCRKSKDGLGLLLSLLPLRSRPGADANLKAPAFVRKYASTATSAEKSILARVVNAQRRLFNPDVSFDVTLDVSDLLLRSAFELESLWGREDEIRRATELGELATGDARIETQATNRIAAGDAPHVRWAPMRIEQPDRPARIQTPRYRSRYRATDTGAVFRYPSRVAIDSAVFATRRRVPGGTLLIDVSGSMRLSADDVEQIVTRAPLATVAIYSGDGVKGTLRIIAKDGSRVGGEKFKAGMGGGNCVDGPALRWLVGQSEPRVWVCDGHVTGVGDNSDPHLTQEAFTIARVGRVVRVANASDAVDAFESPRKLTDYIKARFRQDAPAS